MKPTKIKHNPLLNFSGPPRFNEIEPRHFEPALDYMLDSNRNQIKNISAVGDPPTWGNFVEPIEAFSDQLERLWAPISHLNSVLDSEESRAAFEACLPKITEYGSELGQNKALFKKFQQLKASDGFTALTEAQKKAIDNELRDFSLSGINLDKAARNKLKKINNQLSELGNQFSQNILDATDAWNLEINDKDDLAGLPESAIDAARNRAEQFDKDGWLFGLQSSSYVPFITYANNNLLREQMYRAYVGRASDVGVNPGQWDNSTIICEILKLRFEKTEILGFKDYATYALQTRMADDPEQVADFLIDMATRSRAGAQEDLAELEAFAANKYGVTELQPWDYAWYGEKLRLEKFDISQEALRPYFPLPKVIQGLFDIVNKIFGISLERAQADHLWHPQVQYFRISDRDGNIRGSLYMDLFSRKHKQGGAWMAECIGRRKLHDDIQLPVAFLTCNFPEPVNDQPGLLSHDEVITLFHEFGHGLHHLLTKVDVAGVAGISGVPWDAVELPSQFLENWCWEKAALDMISSHYQTGEPLPGPVLDKMRAARNFQSAMQMLRQIEFSLFDLELHRQDADIGTPKSVRKILDSVRDRVAVVKAPAFNKFENGFSHIFSGGYAAGYYGYLWAEVLSADAYSLFEENGIFDQDTGRAFMQNILEKGGSSDPMELFRVFRGRNPDVAALLRHSGLSLEDIAA